MLVSLVARENTGREDIVGEDVITDFKPVLPRARISPVGEGIFVGGEVGEVV